MKLVGENFSRNGRNLFKGTVRAVTDDGAPMGWADTINLYSRREKEALVSNLVSDLAIALDVARAMVNQLHQELEAKLKAAEGLPEEEDSKATQASTLVALAEGADLWHTPDGDAYATVEIAGHRETWGLSAKAFRSWLSFLFYQAEAKAPGIQAIYGAISVLRGKALFEGEERVVFTRVAEVGAVIYLDLANSSWEAVEISADGWSRS